MPIRFSSVTDADFDDLFSLRLLAMRPSLERIGRFNPAVARARFESTFRHEHTRRIFSGSTCVGCVALIPIDGAMEIQHFYLYPEHQGKGHGSATLTALLAETDANRQEVRLGVLKQSEAIRFYECFGFQKTGEDEWDVYFRRLAKSDFP